MIWTLQLHAIRTESERRFSNRGQSHTARRFHKIDLEFFQSVKLATNTLQWIIPHTERMSYY
jgi:hypothetical protein